MEHLREDDKEEVSTETSIKMGTSPLDSGADVFEDDPADAVDGVKVACDDPRSNTGEKNKQRPLGESKPIDFYVHCKEQCF